MACEIRIGTSGWHYRHWLGTFYPEGLPTARMFEYYQRFFDTVELNNSFYRLPTPEAFTAWREAAPPNFSFAVKGSRFLTHNKKLKEPEQALLNLLPRAELLGKKLGPILFQLPPKWKVNVERLSEFLEALPRSAGMRSSFANLPGTRQPYTTSCVVTTLPIAFTSSQAFTRRLWSPPISLMCGCTGRAESIRDATQTKSCASGRSGSRNGAGN